eukprot:8479031-Alexandrium_andersonii.AAC.1
MVLKSARADIQHNNSHICTELLTTRTPRSCMCKDVHMRMPSNSGHCNARACVSAHRSANNTHH